MFRGAIQTVSSASLSISVECKIFFFKQTSPPQTYTLSLHDALPIFEPAEHDGERQRHVHRDHPLQRLHGNVVEDRKSTRLNSSHVAKSYAVFCVKQQPLVFERSSARPLQSGCDERSGAPRQLP